MDLGGADEYNKVLGINDFFLDLCNLFMKPYAMKVTFHL